MLRSKTFYLTCGETWWSLKGSSLLLAQTLGSSLVLAQTVDLCKTFYSTLAGNWCNFKRSYRIFSPSSIDAWCYVTRSCLVRAQTPHIAFQDLLFYMRKHLMVSERIFSCTCTDAWCYINRHSLVLAQTLVVIRSSLVLARLHRRFVWCYVKRSSLVLAQTLDATLQGAGQKGGHTIGGYGAGDWDHTCIYIYIYTHIDIDVNGLYLSTNNEGFVSLQGQTSHASELCTWIWWPWLSKWFWLAVWTGRTAGFLSNRQT